MATALDQGLGVREVTGAGGRGRVLAVYRSAAYLRFPAGLFALTSAGAPPGPLHLRVAVLPVLRPGQPVRVTGAALSGPDWTIGLDAPTWIGTLPTPSPPAPRTPCDGDPHLTSAGLAVLARAWGGRGPGLTPYGDDLLAGALLATRARRGPAAAPHLAGLASAVSTTAVAAAFLRWAALGQCIEPAHAWLGAAADRDQVGMARAAGRLSAIGASSGHGLLTGMTLAFSSRATTPTRSG